MPPPYRDPSTLDRLYQLELEKEGIIYKQGKFFKNSWTEYYAFISKRGFFHLFDTKLSSNPTTTIKLHFFCKISITNENIFMY